MNTHCEICKKNINLTSANKRRKHFLCDSKKCKSILYSNIKLNRHSEDILKSNAKRKETNLSKYGREISIDTNTLSNCIKNSYKNLQERLNNITIDMLYNKEKIVEKLSTNKYHYTRYIGKSKNRTLINDDIILYKSILHHTKYIDDNELYGNKRVPLTLRLLVAGKYQFNLTPENFCLCGSKLTFNPYKIDFSGFYCKSCKQSANNKEHFKRKFGIEWEKKYEEYCQKMKISSRYKNRLLSVNKIINDTKRLGKVYCPNIGKNETILLNNIETTYNIKLDRNFTVRGYHPDGYCHETNTIFEVYESYHKYQKEYDETRMEEIKKELKCNVSIIYDDWNGIYHENKYK
jgi:very-short-patch-repair endonuclease